MKRVAWLAGLIAVAYFSPLRAQDTSPEPFVVERTLWVKPGRVAQFNGLYQRVEVVRLEALRKQGLVRWYRIAQPLLAADNDSWDLRVTIGWRDAAAAAGNGYGKSVRAANGASTERLLLDELIVDQRERWVQETLRSAD